MGEDRFEFDPELGERRRRRANNVQVGGTMAILALSILSGIVAPHSSAAIWINTAVTLSCVLAFNVFCLYFPKWLHRFLDLFPKSKPQTFTHTRFVAGDSSITTAERIAEEKRLKELQKRREQFRNEVVSAPPSAENSKPEAPTKKYSG